MIDAKAREALQGLARVLGSALAALRVSPHAVTLAGLGLVALSSWQVVDGHFTRAGGILAVGGAFDFLDGAVARARGLSSRFGAVLDSVTDRLSDGLVLGSLLWVYLERGERVAAGVALGALVCVQLVSYVRAKAESLGFSCNVGLMERAERLIVICVGLLFGVVPAALWVLAVLSALTVAQRLAHVHRQARERTGA